jgi:hypothetical protein
MDAHKPGAATGPATRAARVAALTRLIARCPERLLITVRTTDGEELAEYDLPAADGPQPEGCGPESPQPEPPRKKHAPSHPLRSLLLDVLTDAHPDRMTVPAIMDELVARGAEWSQKHVERFLKAMKEDAVVDNDKDERGQGYGFR